MKMKVLVVALSCLKEGSVAEMRVGYVHRAVEFSANRSVYMCSLTASWGNFIVMDPTNNGKVARVLYI